MEVVVNEEKKKKIFRAKKTMKISDRQQLESLHSTLLTSSPGLSNSPPPLMNGTHKEDAQKLGDKEQVDSDSNSSNATPVPASPAPVLSLNLSPSPGSSQSPNTKEDQPVSPGSPFHSLNSELKKLETNEEEEPSSPTVNLDIAAAKEAETTPEDSSEPVTENLEVQNEETEDQAEVDSVEDSEGLLPPVMQEDSSEPIETDTDSSRPVDSDVAETKTDQQTDQKPPSPQSCSDVSRSPPPATSSAAAKVAKKEGKTEKIKEEIKPLTEIKKEHLNEKMDVDVITETKSDKHRMSQSRPSSTPPSYTVKEESTSGLKRTLSDGFEPSGPGISRQVKRPKMEREEFEAQLELKITAKAGNHHKLEKIVQKLVEEKVRVLEMAIFDKNLQELKNRVDQIDCTTKHQTAINALQAKISRLSKKFGEANQVSENKKKQEAPPAPAPAVAVSAATPNTTPSPVTPSIPAAPAAKTVSSSPQTQKPRPSVEVKQTTTVAVASTSIPTPATTTPAISTPVPTTTALVSQTPILQLIASTSNAVSNFTASSTTQSPTSTLVLKNGMMATGQPLLIQLPLSMTNGQTGTLVNIPVSSLNAATSLNKSKTTAPTTFILKSAPTTSSVVPNALTATTVPTLQASPAQVPASQISLARAVYQGGAGAITTPSAGVSVATVRAPTQSVSVAGALSSTSSPVTSGPAATGSAAPGPPQGTSLTTKTDNQATGSASSKVATPTARPKGSVIDLTEEDDDVLVTGVKSATVTTPSATRTQTSITNSARSSPQTNQNSTSSSQLSTQQRSLLDPKPRSAMSTPTRGSSVALPPLPSAPPPLRLPPEAEKTSPPQQPQLKLVPSQTGIVLSWCVAETDLTCAAVDSYHLYAFHQDNSSSNPAQQHWKKIGEVKALPLPMACTLTQFQSGSTYHFAVRAKDIYGRFGAFCEPQCTNVNSSSLS